MGSSKFYVDYEDVGPYFTDQHKEEVEKRLWALAREHSDIVGASVTVTAPGQSETPFLYQARIVIYARPEDIAAIKKDDTVEGALKAALTAIERQVRDKREKLGEPWKRKDIPGTPGHDETV